MRRVIKWFLAVILVLLAAWIALWWYAEGRLAEGLVAWAGRVNASSTTRISYDGIKRGGSPLMATATLVNPRISSQPRPADAPVTISGNHVRLRVDAANPLVLHFDLPAQINVSTSRGDGAVTFGGIAMSTQLSSQALFDKQADPFTGGDMAASNVNILASGGSLLLLHIDSLAGHVSTDRSAGADQAALLLTDSIDGIKLSPLLTKLGRVPFGGRITHLGMNLTVSGPVPAKLEQIESEINALPRDDKEGRKRISAQVLHEWAKGQGHGEAGVSLIVGPTTLNAGGTVKFDANAQPSGTASVTADHLDSFANAVTNAYPEAEAGIDNLEARLSPYLAVTDQGGQTLTVHVTYGDGMVKVNGEKMSDMKPIDWDKLEGQGSAPDAN